MPLLKGCQGLLISRRINIKHAQWSPSPSLLLRSHYPSSSTVATLAFGRHTPASESSPTRFPLQGPVRPSPSRLSPFLLVSARISALQRVFSFPVFLQKISPSCCQFLASFLQSISTTGLIIYSLFVTVSLPPTTQSP